MEQKCSEHHSESKSSDPTVGFASACARPVLCMNSAVCEHGQLSASTVRGVPVDRPLRMRTADAVYEE